MVELVNKKTGEVIIFPTPDHSKPATKIDTLPLHRDEIKEKTMKMKFNHKTWIPIDESGEISYVEFNKRFPIVMAFKFNTLFRTHRIRFVKHPNLVEGTIRVFHNSIPRTWMFWLWKRKKGIRTTNLDNLTHYEEVLLIPEAEIKYGIKLM